jgi:hypothetical protein
VLAQEIFACTIDTQTAAAKIPCSNVTQSFKTNTHLLLLVLVVVVVVVVVVIVVVVFIYVEVSF